MVRSILIVDDNAFIRKALCSNSGVKGISIYAARQETDATQSRRRSNCDPI